MQQETFVVGVDYGALSGRALVVRVGDGEELGTAVHDYPHGVMDATLAVIGEKLPPEWALQVPQDYREVLQKAAHAAWTGLPKGIAVAVGNVDAHVTAPVAAGAYPSVAEAGKAMGRVERGKYQPNPEAAEAYDGLFAEYQLLHDYFGRGANDVMKRLEALRKEALA